MALLEAQSMAENAMSILRRELCLVAKEAAAANIPLIIGGGVGLALRDEMVRAEGAKTIRSFHSVRPTTDLDVFLTAEVISNPSKTEAFRKILDELGFKPVESALYYQFFKPMPSGSPLQEVKLDLLAPLPADNKNVSVGDRRIRPHGFKGLHAHVTREAMTVEEILTPISLRCNETDVTVFVPHPFSYIVLKLFAFRDRRDDPEKLYGSYHAFDIYNSLAMMTEEQFDQGVELRERFADHDQLREAQSITETLFKSPNDLGILRIREHLRQVGIREDAVDLQGFLRDLHDLLD